MTRILIMLWALAACCPVAWAGRVPDLYEAEIPVADQSQAGRDAAMVQALRAVLVKVTGLRDPAARPGYEQLAKQATQLVQQYRYVAPPPGGAATAADQPIQLLWARFDQGALDKALQARSWPVWGPTRPTVLVWLGMESAQGRYILGDQMRDEARAALDSTARRRGLSLVLPLMDLDDHSRVKAADLWTGAFEPFLQAARRYRPDAVVLARLEPAPDGRWRGSWDFHEGGSVGQWTLPASSVVEGVGAGLEAVADTLAQRYAQVYSEAGQGWLELHVAGVTSLDASARAVRYLQTLSMVKQVEVVKVEPDSLTLRVQANGPAQALARLIGLGQVLVAEGDEAGDAAPLRYRLVP